MLALLGPRTDSFSSVFVVVRHFGLGTHRRHGSVWSAPAARRPVDIVCDSVSPRLLC